MTVRLGADDLDELQMPQPDLLRTISGIAPERDGYHVRLDRHGFRSTQRLALAESGGTLVVAFWPAELKGQARYLYDGTRAEALIDEARRRVWDVWPALQLAFYTSWPSQRLYLLPKLDAVEYARRWAQEDAELVRAHSVGDVRTDLWPRVKKRAYATDGDDALLDAFLKIVGRRDVHLRPGLRVRKRFTHAEPIRAEVEAILSAAGEPPLPRPGDMSR
jgi:hypothetical protein